MGAASKASGDAIPDYAKRPNLLPQALFVWTSFISLHSCRYVDGGPIPWSAIVEYSYRYKLNDEELEDLEYFVRKLDDKYLEHMSQQMKSKR